LKFEGRVKIRTRDSCFEFDQISTHRRHLTSLGKIIQEISKNKVTHLTKQFCKFVNIFIENVIFLFLPFTFVILYSLQRTLQAPTSLYFFIKWNKTIRKATISLDENNITWKAKKYSKKSSSNDPTRQIIKQPGN
jgi:hypothetical protein